MKKILLILSMVTILFSCEKGSRLDMETSEQVTLTYDIEAPVEFQIKSTPTTGQGSKINALWYGVYHKKENGSYVYVSEMSDFVQVTNASNISVPIVLFKDQQYKIIFVAQHVSGNTYTYTVDGEGNMSLNPQAAITDGEQLDAFVYWEDTGIIKNDYKRNITLTRPLAQINITTEAAEKPSSLDVTVSSVATSYNIFNSTYTAPEAEVSLTNLQCTGASLGTVYFLTAPGSVQVKMVMKYNNGNPDKTIEIPYVSVAPNFKTNIKGNL
jgi:hypothetical protein